MLAAGTKVSTLRHAFGAFTAVAAAVRAALLGIVPSCCVPEL
jgi:hypothetical protein